MSWYGFSEYVPVGVRRAQAKKAMQKLRNKGMDIFPVEIEGRTIALSFWGKQWCRHMESFHDYHNRLDRGRRYARNGSICHLEIQSRKIKAIVSGSDLYNVTVKVDSLAKTTWENIVSQCRGRIGSMLELLQGKLSDEVMKIVADRETGLLPQPGEIHFTCDCPDYATMCKHVAAVFYGIGNRLDRHPELMFLLRDVEAEELISAELAIPTQALGDDTLANDQLADIFGIELDDDTAATAKPTKRTPKKKPMVKSSKRKTVPKSRDSKERQPVKSSSKKAKSSAKRKTATPKRKAFSAPQSTDSTTAAEQLSRFLATGASIARLRKKLKLTVADFAKAANVTPASVYRWESIRGKVNLQPRIHKTLARMHQKTATLH